MYLNSHFIAIKKKKGTGINFQAFLIQIFITKWLCILEWEGPVSKNGATFVHLNSCIKIGLTWWKQTQPSEQRSSTVQVQLKLKIIYHMIITMTLIQRSGPGYKQRQISSKCPKLLLSKMNRKIIKSEHLAYESNNSQATKLYLLHIWYHIY